MVQAGVLVQEPIQEAKKDWYSPSGFRFKRDQIRWVFDHYEILNEGRWPPKQSGYIDNPYNYQRTRHYSAYFEDAAGIMAEFHYRLGLCGWEGRLVLCAKCLKWDIQHLQAIARVDETRLSLICSRVVNYISGRRKCRSYEEFCRH